MKQKEKAIVWIWQSKVFKSIATFHIKEPHEKFLLLLPQQKIKENMKGHNCLSKTCFH